MPSYLFSALLVLLLVSCALCSATPANQGVELFKKGPVKALKPNGAGDEEIFVDRFRNPSLVLADGVIVGQVCASVGSFKGYLLTKYIGTGGDKWAERAIEDGGKNWKAQLALESPIVSDAVSVLVVKSDTIYGLHISSAEEPASKRQWEFLLSIGRVTHRDDGAISVVWENKTVEERFTKDIQTKLDNVNLVRGSGFVMEDGTFVFVFTGRHGNSGFFVFAHSKDPRTDLTFHFDDKTAPNCYSNIFSWEKKLLLFPLFCDGDASGYKLQESDDMGKTWKESSGKLAENLKGRLFTDTYTPITIGERRLLLFTQAQKKTEDIYNINLFVAYNDQIKPLGFIFTFSGDFAPGPLLYTEDELFYLGAPGSHSGNTILFRLREQLEEIKKLLDGTTSDSASEHARSIMNGNLVHLHVNVAAVLLCVLFGMWAPIAF